ncbi:restriction endonuclease subunit S [Arcobacter porcinus]|uniref:Type I restriction/modification system, specificity subunit n=1 Tax=Arcobacter porcinus TaxID=1935204 RepID=A0A5C2HDF3_9BACT|nr:restriction endonuclease subunit S [Arcobacter porcinus]OCL90669.1 putative type-1 restriction enzyme specificity protein [Aliarcobacter thereius]QEP40827.1 type I restriction/modification system, specificity subunit [Arcobacter porcinus]
MSEFKQGYKQTKVGIIPEDWEVGGLSKIANVEMGQSPLGDTYNTERIGVALINGPTEFTVRYPIKKQWTSKPTKLCKKGDILICVRGSSTGRINISNDEYCIGRGVAAISNKKQKGNIDFIEQILNILSEKILKLTSGSTFPNIDKKTLNEFSIPLPPLKEQEKIAQILTTWDEAITKQTELLESKELQKKGLMQKLLSGEVRFDGFNDEWEEVKLGEIGEFKKGTAFTIANLKEGSIPVIAGGKEPAYYHNEHNRIGKTITVSSSGASAGFINYFEEPIFVSDSFTIKGKKSISDTKYLFFFLSLIQNRIFALQSGGAQPHIYPKDLQILHIKLPSLPEQQKIAEVLSLADDEINLLKNELEELKLQKKALMQKLLTGQVRVKA